MTQIDSLKGGGQPLPRSSRGFFEPRFGYDFSHVRVHTDARATNTARVLNAQAYTFGRDVVFGEGGYVPESTAGIRIIAHELTHVICQNPSIGRGLYQDGAETRKVRIMRQALPSPTAGTGLPPVASSDNETIARAIALFMASSVAATILGRKVLKKLIELNAEAEIGYAELKAPPGLIYKAEARPGIYGWGKIDIAVNMSYRRRMIETSLEMVHEALHHIVDEPYVDQELIARDLQIKYYSELQQGINFGPNKYVVPQGLDPDIEAQRGWQIRKQLVDYIISMPIYADSLDTKWVRKHLHDWGGIPNRWLTTKARYLQVFCEEKAIEDIGRVILIFERVKNRAEFTEVLRLLGSGDVDQGLK